MLVRKLGRQQPQRRQQEKQWKDQDEFDAESKDAMPE